MFFKMCIILNNDALCFTLKRDYNVIVLEETPGYIGSYHVLKLSYCSTFLQSIYKYTISTFTLSVKKFSHWTIRKTLMCTAPYILVVVPLSLSLFYDIIAIPLCTAV